MKLRDDYQYPIKGSGEASYKLDSRKSLKMKDVLYVPGLKKNILSIFALDSRGIRVSFVDGQVFYVAQRKDNRGCNSDWRRGRRIVQAKGIA